MDQAKRLNIKKNKRTIEDKLMDCSIVGPLELPSFTCGDYFFFHFLYIFFSHVESKAPEPKAVSTTSTFDSHSHKQTQVYRRGYLQNTYIHSKHCRKGEKKLQFDKVFIVLYERNRDAGQRLDCEGCIKLYLHNAE